MNSSIKIFEITRKCTNCKQQKPVRGSTTRPKFLCATCKKLVKKDK